MNIYLSISLLIKVTMSSLATFNIYPNENIFLQQLIYETNDNYGKFDEKNINDVNIELLKEIKLESQQALKLNGNERLFSFTLKENKKEDIDIVLLRNSSIECLYQIENYIQNNDIIMKKKQCQIKLNYSDCFQLYKLEQEIYIVQCYFNQNNTIIQILNQSQIFDQIVIPIQYQCQSDSIFQKKTLIIFNKNCVTTILYSIQIFNLKFSNIKTNDLTQIEGFTENNQQIISLEFNIYGDIFIIQDNYVYVLLEKYNKIQCVYQIQSFNILKVYPYKSPTLKLIVQENLEKTQIYLGEKQLNFSSVNFKNVFLIRQSLYLFYFEDKLLITISKYQEILQINTKNLIQVGQLPFLMALSNEQIVLIKIRLPKSYISYKDLDSIFAVSIRQNEFSPLEINLKLFDPNKPIQHFQNKNIYHQIKALNDEICLPYCKYQRNFPIKINQIMQNGITLNFFQEHRSQSLFYLNRILSQNRVLILNKINEQKVLIGFIQGNNSFKLIFYENAVQIKSQIIQLHENLIDIFLLRTDMVLIILYQNQIEIYQIKFEGIKKRIHQTQKKILKAFKLNFYLLYLLEDCTRVEIQFFEDNFIFVETQYQFDCKSSLQFYQDDIYIDTHSIYYRALFFVPQKITLKEKILEASNVLFNYFLIFTSDNNQLFVKLFSCQQDELFFLYTLPTYNYTIQFPFQYKILQNILIIKARKDDQGFFLLIYDLKNTAISSLISINQIDEEDNYSFDFINDEEYFFTYQKHIYVQTLNQPCFSLQLTQVKQDFIENIPLVISIKSLISNEDIDINFHLLKFNLNYTLQLSNLSQSILIGNIVNFDNIFGNIENVEIVGSENIFIYQPLIFTNYSAICSYYRFGICIDVILIFRNIFDQNTSIKFSEIHTQDIQQISFNNENCNHEFYILESISLVVYEYNFCNIIEGPNRIFITNVHQIQNIKLITDLQVLDLFNTSTLLHFQYQPFLDQTISNYFERLNFDQFDGIKINNFTYLLLNTKLSFFYLRVFKFTQDEDGALYDILLNKQYESEDLIEDLKIELNYENFSKIQIYHIENISNQFQIKFIIITREKIAVLVQIILDLNNLNNVKLQLIGIIRYEDRAIFKTLLFIDHNFVVLTFSQNEDSFINVFDISNLRKNKNIDSIQKLKDNDYTFIERYNESHFTLVEKIGTSLQKVHLITLDKFRIECQGQCTQPSYLKLSNQVSQILIELHFENEQEKHSNLLQLFMVVFTFICIFIQLYCKKQIKIGKRIF